MERPIDRRTFVLGALAGAGATALGADPTAARPPRSLARAARFRQGVASGFPRPDQAWLWTRLEDVAGRTREGAWVELEVARDAGFRRLVSRRRVLAAPGADWTVHARVGASSRARSTSTASRPEARTPPVGRLRTVAPAGSREPVRIAFFSCQEYIAGFYHAHADLARLEDVDLVLCLGDYVYERAFADRSSRSRPVREDRSAADARQKGWLKAGLRRSRATWKVVANQVMIMSLDAPPRRPLNTDAWDGYAAERRELVDFIARERIADVTFVTGDIHTFFAGNVTRTGRQVNDGFGADGPSRATEFVGGSITSPGIVDRIASSEVDRLDAAGRLDAAVRASNPHMVYSNQAYKGYAVLDAGRDELRVEYRAVRDTRLPRSEVFTLRRFSVARGRPVVVDRGARVRTRGRPDRERCPG